MSRVKDTLWRRGQLQWKLHSMQLIVYKALRALPKPIREAVVLISRRWGKSYLGVIMALEDCLQNPGVQVFITGPDLKQTRRILAPLIRLICQDAPAGLITQTKSELTWTVGESTLLIGAFDTALESFRGLEAFSIYVEETGLADIENYEYTIKSVLRPTLMHSRGRIHHLTTPPSAENHPFVVHTLPEAALNKALFTYTIEDNPLLSKEDIEAEIQAAGGRQSSHCRRELFCEIVRDEHRVIIPEIADSHCVRLKQPDYTYFLTSVDFGGSQDKHALILTYFDFQRNKFCVVDEVFLDINTGTDQVMSSVLQMEKRNKVKWLKNQPKRIIDAQPQTLIDIKRMGLVCSAPEKGKDSVEDGIQALRVAFLKNQIEIDIDKCPILIQTLKYGMWNKKRDDFQRTDALGHCDMLAALSYAFRHTDKFNNPFPAHIGMHKDTHYFEVARNNDNEDELDKAFYQD